MKSVILPAAALALAASAFPSPEARAENLVQYWADGVGIDHGWTDGQQYPNHCWASTCSNMLAWWQDRLAEKYVLPEDVLRTASELQELYATEQGDVQSGQLPAYGLMWYFGQYYPNLKTDRFDPMASPYYQNYALYDADEITTSLVANFSTGKTLAALSSTSHAVTLWGIEYDLDSGKITRGWITDSDPTQGDTAALEVATAVYDANGNFSFQCMVYNPETGATNVAGAYDIYEICYINYDDGHLLDAYGNPAFTAIPEPSAFGLLAGTLALALAGTRRRRRKKA